jgi:hypothetical protein
MRPGIIVRLSIFVVTLAVGLPAFAGELGEFFSGIARDTKRRNCWPEPFIYPDRDGVRQVMSSQVAAGWERQNLLSEFHFVTGGKDLTEAGRMRVQWILNEVPESRRQLYVRRANTPQETAARIQAVQQVVSQSPYASNVPVLESTRSDDGWPADRIDTLNRRAIGAMLEPKLMGGSEGGSGGGGGGH